MASVPTADHRLSPHSSAQAAPTRCSRTARGTGWRVLGTWAAAGAIGFGIVKGTSWGPVVYVVNEERGWGVHTGDALVLAPALVAALVTWRLAARTR